MGKRSKKKKHRQKNVVKPASVVPVRKVIKQTAEVIQFSTDGCPFGFDRQVTGCDLVQDTCPVVKSTKFKDCVYYTNR